MRARERKRERERERERESESVCAKERKRERERGDRKMLRLVLPSRCHTILSMITDSEVNYWMFAQEARQKSAIGHVTARCSGSYEHFWRVSQHNPIIVL